MTVSKNRPSVLSALFLVGAVCVAASPHAVASWPGAEKDPHPCLYVTPTDDYATLEKLFVDAMAIWLPNLPDIPLTELYHRIPYNETYWTNWPTDENPYVNGASWHLTFEMVLWNLKAVEQ